ncbi:MAG: tRNA (guanosine(37)-N1)-methyltransferase TrmD [Alphaproteobacteria bacterium]
MANETHADAPRQQPWRAIVLTIFPEMFPGPLGESLVGKALEAGRWTLAAFDIREFARDRHRSVDDVPFGGGPGMVMRPEVIDAAMAAAVDPGLPIIYLSPRGRRLDQSRVRGLAGGAGAVLLCGRYEGIDQRVLDAWNVEELSLGDFVLSGGELAAMTVIDAVVRLLPGVIGEVESLAEESFERGLLEYPHYTRPRRWRDRGGNEREVPEVLVSGHHEKISEWRRAQSEKLTRDRRPDLWSMYERRRGTER